MKLVMTLLCRNEEDIIASNLDFHLAQGVDFVIATDNGSKDCTVDILLEYERRGVLKLLHEAADDYNQTAWVTRMAREASTTYAADWVINNDADEFWWPLAGNLKTTLSEIAADTEVVAATRYNFVPVTEEHGPFFQRMVTREVRSFNAVGAPLPDKVCHRGYADIVVEQGNHGVSRESPMHASEARPIEILHFPLRSYEQFERKIATGGAAYERNTSLPPYVGETWRRLYQLYRRGELPAYYQQQMHDRQRLKAGIASGLLVVDCRLKDFLAASRG